MRFTKRLTDFSSPIRKLIDIKLERKNKMEKIVEEIMNKNGYILNYLDKIHAIAGEILEIAGISSAIITTDAKFSDLPIDGEEYSLIFKRSGLEILPSMFILEYCNAILMIDEVRKNLGLEERWTRKLSGFSLLLPA
jgi:hypothetical protein